MDLALILLPLLHSIPPIHAGTLNNNNCPAGQFIFGPCVANQCPPTCPGTCACFGPGNQDCCSTVNGQNGQNGNNNGLLTRLLLALLLSSPGPIRLPSPVQLGLVLCRDLALNCALYFPLYCTLPPYSLCMRTHCAATCGVCNDGLGLGPLLLSLLGLDGGGAGGLLGAGGNAAAILAVRAGAPPIKGENGRLIGPRLVMKSERNGSDQNAAAMANAPTLQLAIPPGLLIPDKIRQRMAAIARRLNGG